MSEQRRRSFLENIERFIYFLAAIAGVAGVAFWVVEFPDREDEREARQSELVARANEILERASGTAADVDSEQQPAVNWAIRTLVKYKQPVVMTGATVWLSGLDLDCAVLDIRADNFGFNGSLSRTTITWSGSKFALHDTAAAEVMLNLDPTVPQELGFHGGTLTSVAIVDLLPGSKVELDAAQTDDVHVNLHAPGTATTECSIPNGNGLPLIEWLAPPRCDATNEETIRMSGKEQHLGGNIGAECGRPRMRLHLSKAGE